jgi:FlaA1/EpsC-like NDP-sugar epimerase
METGGAILKKRDLLVTLLYFLDTVVLMVSVMFSVWMRSEFKLSALTKELTRGSFWTSMVLLAVVYACAFTLSRTYQVLWEYASLRDVCIVSVCAMGSSIVFALMRTVLKFPYFAPSIYIMAILLSGAGVVAIRMVLRTLKRKPWRGITPKSNRNNTMIIGAGAAANILLHEIKTSPALEYYPVCILDDSPEKRRSTVYGVKVVGNCDKIEEIAEKYDIKTIIFAIPSATPERKGEILRRCSKTGCVVKTLPSIGQMIDKKFGLSNIRSINIEDLLGRPPIKIKLDSVMDYVSGKTVLVTGGGGSIGSELCRQIAEHSPHKLIIFDIYENNAYAIQNELQRTHPEVDVKVLIGSVRDSKRLDAVFSRYHPNIVYHAAAHKHVPLMEDNPNEAVKNNVFGTLKTVRTADKFGVERFVLISTDKAVNPTNVMGATKRICEMIVQTYNKHSETEFVAVRFGNVLGSNGSVIPLFKDQIANGGPVTATHKDIIRYFMTIPEAVSLVLQAGASARGGEIFVLDMGEPVKIVDLAENIIRLSGYTPYKDIDIKFTGLRPGEKLYEELLMDEEGLEVTENNLIHIGKPIDINEDEFFADLEELSEIMYDDNADVRRVIKKIVKTYREPGRSTPAVTFLKKEEETEFENERVIPSVK